MLERVREVLGTDGYRLEFTETLVGNASPPRLAAARTRCSGWVDRTDPGARCLPTLSVGYSDSRTFRDAFPDCVAYGFFPYRHMTLEQLGALAHGRDERIDVRDLALAVDCYRARGDRAAGLIPPRARTPRRSARRSAAGAAWSCVIVSTSSSSAPYSAATCLEPRAHGLRRADHRAPVAAAGRALARLEVAQRLARPAGSRSGAPGAAATASSGSTRRGARPRRRCRRRSRSPRPTRAARRAAPSRRSEPR